MNVLIPAYVRTTNFIADRADILRNPKDRGAGMIEYAALIVLAAVVLGVLIAIVPAALRRNVGQEIDGIFRKGH